MTPGKSLKLICLSILFRKRGRITASTSQGCYEDQVQHRAWHVGGTTLTLAVNIVGISPKSDSTQETETQRPPQQTPHLISPGDPVFSVCKLQGVNAHT